MRQVLLINVLAVLCGASKQSIVDDLLNKVAEEARSKMKDIYVEELKLTNDIYFKNILIQNLENFDMFEETSMIPMTIKNLTVNLTYVEVLGFYNIENLPEWLPIHVFGSGTFNIRLEGMGFYMKASIRACDGISATNGICIKNMDGLDFMLTSSKIQFEGLMGDKAVGGFVNDLISEVLPDIIDSVKPWVISKGKPILIQIINNILSSRLTLQNT